MRWRVLSTAISAMVAFIASLLATDQPGVAGAGPGRGGKVVRVERPKAIASDGVQICGIDTTAGEPADSPRLMCFGEAPRVGATVEFVDESGYRGSGRVLRSEPGLSMFSRCEEKSGHTVYFEWTSGAGSADPSSVFGASLAGVIGVKVNPSGAKLLTTPDRRPPAGEASAYAIGLDADGDTRADLVVLVRECRDTAPPLAGTSGSQHMPVFCLDYWLYSRSDWKLVNQAVVYNCL